MLSVAQVDEGVRSLRFPVLRPACVAEHVSVCFSMSPRTPHHTLEPIALSALRQHHPNKPDFIHPFINDGSL
ncbi:hypothetical protein AAFF_G00417620 [Aldrovandia affinis]|uniref:Uncharacterized protein n=1 Tax=Aldrovandia affinis TaxID=143900 RepID=A0AAD7SA86_9TELE|nr:hypothetical protein AAFF_G00417620 [Aldrovandia affinis]